MLHDDARVLAARADMARLLSACFCEPTRALADEQVFAALAPAANAIDPALAAQVEPLGAAFDADDLQALRVDYTRLFLGPEGALAHPYGSVWLGDTQSLVQESTLAVGALYEAHGFALADDFSDLPDHVAVELEFLYTQLFREAVARRDGQTEQLIAARAARRALLDAHLGRWMPPFAAAIERGAGTTFYRALAGTARAFIAGEAARN